MKFLRNLHMKLRMGICFLRMGNLGFYWLLVRSGQSRSKFLFHVNNKTFAIVYIQKMIDIHYTFKKD